MGSEKKAVIADKAFGAMFGLAIGDALGATLEFSARDTRPVVRDLIGGGPVNLKPGQWTDDTSMALCLADSLISRRGFDGLDLLERFVMWWRDGWHSVTGRCFDIGVTTQRSLQRYEDTGLVQAGPEDPSQAGNGSIMRLAPAAIYAAGDAEEAERLADAQSRTTHPAPVAHDACRFLARLLTEAITGQTKASVLRSRDWNGSQEVCAIAGGAWKGKTRAQISSSGYVIDTLEAALWCTHQSDSFEDAVILAANLGDDADTVAAVTGQLAGALWGFKSMPDRWVETIAWGRHIIERTGSLLRAAENPGIDSSTLGLHAPPLGPSVNWDR